MYPPVMVDVSGLGEVLDVPLLGDGGVATLLHTGIQVDNVVDIR